MILLKVKEKSNRMKEEEREYSIQNFGSGILQNDGEVRSVYSGSGVSFWGQGLRLRYTR